MNFYTRSPPIPINIFKYYDSYKNLVDNNAKTIPTPFLSKKDLTPTNIFPVNGYRDEFNRPSYYHNSFPRSSENPNITFKYKTYPAYYPELNNLNAISTTDYGLSSSTNARTVGNIVY